MTRWILIFILGLAGFRPALARDILIARRSHDIVEQFADSLQKKLSKNYSLSQFIYEQDNSKAEQELYESILKEKPKAMLLLDNKAVSMAKHLYDSHPELMQTPSVATLGLNLKNLIDSQKYPMAGVAYEVSGFSLVTQYRYLFEQPVDNVLVLYRSKNSLQSLIEDARKQLERERISLIAVDIDKLSSAGTDLTDVISSQLKEDHQGKAIQAVWVFSDNGLLKPEFFKQAWELKAQKLPIPFLCTIEELLKQFQFCTFAVYPNHEDLAVQTSDMLRSILEDGIKPSELGVEYVISNKTAIKQGLMDQLHLRPIAERLNQTQVFP